MSKRGKKVKRLRSEEEKKLGTWEDKKIGSSQLLNFLTSQLPICLFTILPFLTGCAGVRPEPLAVRDLTALSWTLQTPLGKVQNLSLEQIRDTLGAENKKFTTLKAKAQITLEAPATEGTLICDGYIRLQKPNKLRIIGTKLISTVFDMLIDGERFWLYLPSEKTVYTGRYNSMYRSARWQEMKKQAPETCFFLTDDIAMPLDYNDIFTPCAILTKFVGARHAVPLHLWETWPGLWLIHLVDLENETATLRANLYVDRVDVNVIRYDIFDTGGNIKVQALFDDYAQFGDSTIPQRIVISWLNENTTIKLSLTNIITNEQINPKVFQFSKPETAEVVFLDDM